MAKICNGTQPHIGRSISSYMFNTCSTRTNEISTFLESWLFIDADDVHQLHSSKH